MDESMNSKRIYIPSLLTSFNLFCGFTSITLVITNNFIFSGWLIIFASVFDAFDGKLARKYNLASKFGVEADSFADLVSFGVAPAVLLYNLYFKLWGILGLVLSFIPLLCTTFRLVRFNVESSFKKHDTFSGLPSPMAAIALVSLVFLVEAGEIKSMDYGYLPLVVLVSLLMVSRIPYDSLPAFSFKQSRINSVKLLYLIICFAGVICAWQFILFPAMLFYLLYGLIHYTFRTIKVRHDAFGLDEIAR